MKVEELEGYGAALEMPKEAVKKQSKIMLSALIGKFGVLCTLSIFWDTLRNTKKLKREYPETLKKVRTVGKVLEKELFVFSGIFLSIAKRLGREEAYEFFKSEIINEIAKISIPSIYQVDDLKNCEGDIFENFKKMNIALFERTTKDGTWNMESYNDEDDKLTIKVTTCANVELFGELKVPELGKFGCDHDLAGYTVIEDDVNCEFRRLCTIAKGDDHCMFEFYRKGAAPNNAHLNK